MKYIINFIIVTLVLLSIYILWPTQVVVPDVSNKTFTVFDTQDGRLVERCTLEKNSKGYILVLELVTNNLNDWEDSAMAFSSYLTIKVGDQKRIDFIDGAIVFNDGKKQIVKKFSESRSFASDNFCLN